MPVNFFHPSVTWKGKSKPAKKTAGYRKAGKSKGDISSSDSESGIELRLLPPFIKDNNTPAFKPFIKGFAKLYCLVIVVSDANNKMVGGIDLQGFPRIGDKEYLPITKTIFYWQRGETDKIPPTQVHVMCSVVKSKQDLRKVGAILSQVKGDPAYTSIAGKLAGLAKNATAAGAVVGVITELTSIVGKYFSAVEDKPIGTFINSYTVLRGDFDKTGIIPLKYVTPKVDFNLELIVRDKIRAASPKKGLGMTAAAKKVSLPPREKVPVELTRIR